MSHRIEDFEALKGSIFKRHEYVFERLFYPHRRSLSKFKRKKLIHVSSDSHFEFDDIDMENIKTFLQTHDNNERDSHAYGQDKPKNQVPKHLEKVYMKTQGKYGCILKNAKDRVSFDPSKQLSYFVNCMIQSMDPSRYNLIYDEFQTLFDSLDIPHALFQLNKDCTPELLKDGKLDHLGFLVTVLKSCPLSDSTQLSIPSKSTLYSSLMMMFGSVSSSTFVQHRVMTMDALKLAMGLLFYLHWPNQHLIKIHHQKIQLKPLHLQRMVDQTTLLLSDLCQMEAPLDEHHLKLWQTTLYQYIEDYLGSKPTYRLVNCLELLIGLISNMIDFNLFLVDDQRKLPCSLQILDAYLITTTPFMETEREELYADVFKEQASETTRITGIQLMRFFIRLHAKQHQHFHHHESLDYSQWPVVVTPGIVLNQMRMFSRQEDLYHVFGSDYVLSKHLFYQQPLPPKVLIGKITSMNPSQKQVQIELISAHGFNEKEYVLHYLTTQLLKKLKEAVYFQNENDFMNLQQMTHPETGIHSFTIPFPSLYLTQLTDYYERDPLTGQPQISFDSYTQLEATLGKIPGDLTQFEQVALVFDMAMKQPISTLDQWVSTRTGILLPIPFDPEHYVMEEFGLLIDKNHPIVLTTLSPQTIQVNVHIRVYHLSNHLPQFREPFLYFIQREILNEKTKLTKRRLLSHLRKTLPESSFMKNQEPLDSHVCPWDWFLLDGDHDDLDATTEGIMLYVPLLEDQELFIRHQNDFFDKRLDGIDLLWWRPFSNREHTQFFQQMGALFMEASTKK